MGQGIGVVCSNCGTIESFRLGVGMMYASLKNMIFLVAPAARKKVLTALSDHDIEEVEYGHALYSCVTCNTMCACGANPG